MIKAQLVDAGTGKQVQISDTPYGNVLTTISTDKLYSVFKSSARTTTGTTIVVQPESGEAITVTDLLISAEKMAGSLTVQFNDGTNAVALFGVALTDAPASFGVPFNGRWMGWRDARIEMITSTDGTALVCVGYTKIPSKHTLSYAEWNALR